ncbi:alpha/beta fold hydrolase [Oerskovia flava]|uniref:alpha/beta fold hydrolase n=1 Tax=Oerskovia flava TaxID=2986422 RepID=UPI002240914A|nr:alpha/beta hydrolase [Oerskovia sp. JB1-3-2]
MRITRDLELVDGRVVRVHDSGTGGAPGETPAETVLWHHGSPQTGALLDPLVEAAQARGIRVVSCARPSYGGSSPHPGRTVASVADDVAQVADALTIQRFAVMGSSGGGPHALACAALLPGRVTAAVCFASVAPRVDDLDWFAGMASDGALRSALEGRAARARFAETEEFDPLSFTDTDWAALDGTWSALGADAGRAGEDGPDGLIDDDVALAAPWGFDVGLIDVPVLLVQGGQDRVVPPSHAHWLAEHCPTAELWTRPHDGHVSVLDTAAVALDWLTARDELSRGR